MDPTLKEAIACQTAFSLRLTAHLLSLPEFCTSNYAFSPLSIHAVLSLLTAGTTGPTLKQLQSFLGSNVDSELSALQSYVSNFLLADGSDANGPCLRYAFGVWVDDHHDTNLANSFREVAETVYKAAVIPAPFRTEPGECVVQINKWVAQATGGKIENLLTPQSVDYYTRVILGNALYFNAKWMNQFRPSITQTRTFFLIDGTSIEVPFMDTTGVFRYLSVHGEFKVVRLPYVHKYDGREFSFYIFLPNTFHALSNLSMMLSSEPDFLNRHIPTEEKRVALRIPKFNITMKSDFSDILKNQGLALPFEETKDFSEMVDAPDIHRYHVKEIAHKCTVEVNEQGTEASAASVVRVRRGGLTPIKPEIKFVADHPFLFFIREDTSGLVLFVGQLLNP